MIAYKTDYPPIASADTTRAYDVDLGTADAIEIARNTTLLAELAQSVQQQKADKGIPFKDVFGHDPA